MSHFECETIISEYTTLKNSIYFPFHNPNNNKNLFDKKENNKNHSNKFMES